jgi:hypothetical protein
MVVDKSAYRSLNTGQFSKSEIGCFQHPQDSIKSILFGMKAVRIVAIAVGTLVVFYMLVITFVPEWMIVGFRFRWPWK